MTNQKNPEKISDAAAPLMHFAHFAQTYKEISPHPSVLVDITGLVHWFSLR